MIFGKIPVSYIWEKDRKKSESAKNNGYLLIVIWEDEIKYMKDDDLVSTIKEKLKENGYIFE